MDAGNVPPFYEDLEKRIAFYPNLRDGPGAYNIKIGNHYFYLPDRVLDDLVRPNMQTRDVMRSLRAINPTIDFILEENKFDPSDMHIALLKVKMKETGEFLDELLSKTRA